MIQYSVPLGINRANCYIIIDEVSKDAAVIDPGAFNADLAGILNREGVSELKFILLTHGHYDHILGVPELKKHFGGKIGIHMDDAGCLSDEHKSHSNTITSTQENTTPDFIFDSQRSMMLGSTEIRVLFTPGHTPGSVCFVIESEHKIFTGDTLFYRTIGRTDFPGGNMADMRNSLRILAEMKNNYTLFPGHDRSSNLDDERKYNRYLRSL